MGVITYFLLCGTVVPSVPTSLSNSTCQSGYTPFDRDTQQQEMEAIIEGDYHFEPGARLPPSPHPL